MALAGIPGVDGVERTVAGFVKQPANLGNGILQVVIHSNDVHAPRMVQSGHDRVVLTEVARELYKDYGHAMGVIGQAAAHAGGVVIAAVVDQHDFVAAFDLERSQLPH